ncbi:NUDIX domain-containing protein [Candidatus Saccharibacteria bacterium]|nr:NUDIX domain-containing protein [Candidatus Saccharibacteria bacterium]
MHQDEMWQLYDKNGVLIAGGRWPSALDNPEKTGSDKIVGAVAVFLYRRGENGLEFLWQKRSKWVGNPGKYDVSAGGHVNLGEDVVKAATREVQEEIGVKIVPEDLRFIMSWMPVPTRIVWYYLVDWTGKEDAFCFDDKEVSEVKWVPCAEMVEFRRKYARDCLVENPVVFEAIDKWLKMQGLVESLSDEKSEIKNYAFIDGNNLYLGAKNQGIELDYRKLRLYLKNKLQVEKALLFIGYDRNRKKLYNMLKRSGFELVFKPAVFYTGKSGNRMMKGNVDAELVLYSAAVEFNNYDQAVVVTGDGDFACLMDFLKRNNKLAKIITPTVNFSLLLKPYIKNILPIEIIKDKIRRNDDE